MSQLFPNLFEPISLGGLEVRNHILSTGHMTCMISGGLPLPSFAGYHEARAKGGCGLIITESAATHPIWNAYNIQLTKDGVVEALGKTVERVKNTAAGSSVRWGMAAAKPIPAPMAPRRQHTLLQLSPQNAFM